MLIWGFAVYNLVLHFSRLNAFLFKSVSELKRSRSCTIFSYVHVWFCNSCFNFLLYLSNVSSQSEDFLVLDIHFNCWPKSYLKPNCWDLGKSEYLMGDLLFEDSALLSEKKHRVLRNVVFMRFLRMWWFFSPRPINLIMLISFVLDNSPQ